MKPVDQHLFQPQQSWSARARSKWRRLYQAHHTSSILIFAPWLWLVNIVQAIVIAVWIYLDGRISISTPGLPLLLASLFSCVIATALICRIEQREGSINVILARLRIGFIGVIFLTTAFTGIRFLNHLSMSLSFPLADDTLDALDRILGLDWHAYALWLGEHREAQWWIMSAYYFTTRSAAITFLLLVLIGRQDRAVEFGSLLFIGAAIAITVGALLPAEAAMVRNMNATLIELFGHEAGVYHMNQLTALRSNVPISMNFTELAGLATFPSYHTIAGLTLVYAWRHSLAGLMIASVWAVAMLLATPIYGGHYFIDVIAGFAVTAILITFNELIKRRASSRLAGIADSSAS